MERAGIRVRVRTRREILGRAAEGLKTLLIGALGQTEIGYFYLRVILRIGEQNVFGFDVPVAHTLESKVNQQRDVKASVQHAACASHLLVHKR